MYCCFSIEDDAAITFAPIVLPIWMAATPVDPDAPNTTNVLPFFNLALCLRA